MKKLLYSILLLFVVNSSFATHNMAGNISYRFVGSTSFPYLYEITVTTFTKWVGTSGTDRCEIMIYVAGDSSLAPRVNGPSINCPSTADGVLIGGCMGVGNVRWNIYKATYNFAGPGAYSISTQDPNLSSGICNIPTSSTIPFTLQGELIISPFWGNNTGPTFAEIPVICDTVGITAYYNSLATDIDGDSLSYELIPLTSPGSSFPSASSSFTIDSTTGTVTWAAPTLICNYVFDIRIKEWRNISGTYYNIGTTMEEVWSQVYMYAGISETTSSTSVSIFPNPSNGLINMNIENGLENQDYQIVISNSMGQIIKTMDISNNTATIPENELSSGIYFYSLSDKTQILNKGKFVILDGNMK